MPTLPLALSNWFRGHHGIAGSAALTRLGVAASLRDSLVEADIIDVVHEGVYRLHAWPVTFESRCAALCAADPTIVITCASCGRLWGLRSCTGDEIHALTTRRTRPVVTGAIIHRCPILPPAHIVRRADGIRLTHPSRMLFDECRHRDALSFESLVEDALNRGQTTVQRLYAIGRLLATPGRAGSGRFVDVLESRPSWRRPVDSHPELVLLDALAQAGLVLDTQVPLALPDGRVIHPDLGRAAIHFYIEVDDAAWHGGRISSRKDRERDRQARLVGARVERVGTEEIEDNLAGIVPQLVQAHDEQAAFALTRSG